jgi:hypothetical protein
VRISSEKIEALTSDGKHPEDRDVNTAIASPVPPAEVVRKIDADDDG